MGKGKETFFKKFFAFPQKQTLFKENYGYDVYTLAEKFVCSLDVTIYGDDRVRVLYALYSDPAA